jgi:cysteine-rich repeat protein
MFYISKIICADPLYPFRMWNATSAKYECYEYCPAIYYEYFSPTIAMRYCLRCLIRCITCESASVCTSCTSNYTLSLSGNCTLSPSLYSNTSGLYYCSTGLVGCINCSKTLFNISSGLPVTISGINIVQILSCSACGVGYYPSAAVDSASAQSHIICTPCSNSFPNCSSCTSLACLSCVPPYVMYTASTCTLMQTPPTPPSPANNSCTSSTCLSCDPTNKSLCFDCMDNLFYVRLNGVCHLNYCGDGKIDAGEACDDANRLSYDGCD